MTENKSNIKQLKLAQKESPTYKISDENFEALTKIVAKVSKELDNPVDNEAIKSMLSLVEHLIEGTFNEVVILGVGKNGSSYMGGGGSAGNKFMVGTLLREYSNSFDGQLADMLGLYNVDFIEE